MPPRAPAGGVEEVDLPAAPLGVADVDPEELGREEPGLVAAGAGPHLDEDVLVVGGVSRDEEELELLLGRVEAGAQGGQLLLGHLAHLGVLEEGLVLRISFTSPRQVRSASTVGSRAARSLETFLKRSPEEATAGSERAWVSSS